MQTETAITERLRRSNTEFRALEESHHRLDAELADYNDGMCSRRRKKY